MHTLSHGDMIYMCTVLALGVVWVLMGVVQGAMGYVPFFQIS